MNKTQLNRSCVRMFQWYLSLHLQTTKNTVKLRPRVNLSIHDMSINRNDI